MPRNQPRAQGAAAAPLESDAPDVPPHVEAEAAALERSERDDKERSEHDQISTISSGEDPSSLVDLDRDENIDRLVAFGYTQEEATAMGYDFNKSSPTPELTAPHAAQLAAARAIKVDKASLRASLGPHLKSERFNYALAKGLLDAHNQKFPQGNFSAMTNLSVEGVLSLRGVPVAPGSNMPTKFVHRRRPAPSGGGAGGGGEAAPRSIHDLTGAVPRHLLANRLTSRPKSDLLDEELALIGELTTFGFGCLQNHGILLSNVIVFNVEMLHVEQKFIFDTVKALAEIAVEDNVDWGQSLQAKLAALQLHEYDDNRQRPTVLARWAAELKALHLTDGVLAFELLKDCFKAPLVCKADNISISELFAWDYDLQLSATANLANLELLRETLRRTVYEPYHELLSDKSLCGIFVGSFVHPDLFTLGHETIAIQTLRDLLLAEPAILLSWPLLRVEIEKLQQGACFRGHVTGQTAAAAYGAQGAPPPQLPKPKPTSKPRPTAASVPKAVAPPPAPPKQEAKTTVPAVSFGKTPLARYFEALSCVREFLGIVEVPLNHYLEPVVVNGVATHRWKMEQSQRGKAAGVQAKLVPKFIPKQMVEQAKQLQVSGALPFITSSLYKVKNARTEGNEHFIKEVHQHARIVASILAAGASATSEEDFAALLEAEATGGERPAPDRRAAAAALADGVRALAQLAEGDEAEEDGDDVSEVTADTLNFVTAFSNMALGDAKAVPPVLAGGAGGPVRAGGSGGAGGPVRATSSGKNKKKHRAGKAGKPKGILSGEAQGAAAAASEADL